MKGMKKKLTSSKTANDPNSRINKSLRAGTADMKTFKQFCETSLTPVQKDASINARYKSINNPQKPADSLKPSQIKKGSMLKGV